MRPPAFDGGPDSGDIEALLAVGNFPDVTSVLSISVLSIWIRHVVNGTANPHTTSDDAVIDHDLVVRAMAGERDAFASLVERHHARILAMLERLSGCAEQARDLAQETFVSAYRHLASFRHDSRFSTWLHAIACNQAATAARRRRPVASLDAPGRDGGAAHEPYAPLLHVGARLEQAELRTRVKAALAQLDERYRKVVVLSDMQGESYEEIATALDIPIGTVRSRLHRGRTQLRSLLATE